MRTPVVVAALGASLLLMTPARAGWKSKHIDGVIASVDGHPIMLSEVRARAKLILSRMDPPPPATSAEKRAQQEAEVMEAIVERLIREGLVAADMDHARMSVTNDDVDNALKYLAEAQKITKAELLAAAKRAGVDEREYRAEIRRQVLEAKWTSRRPPGVTEKEALEKLAKIYVVERGLL